MDQDLSTQHSALSTDVPTQYQIGGVRYRIEPASYRQHRWLAEGPLKGVDLGVGMAGNDLHDLIQRHGAEILAIVLLEDGQSRQQKAHAGLAEALTLVDQIECEWTPQEVREAAERFFVIDGFANLAFFIDFRKVAAGTPVEPMANGSTPVSASLPAATSPSAPTSSAEPVLATASRTSGGSSSGSSPT